MSSDNEANPQNAKDNAEQEKDKICLADIDADLDDDDIELQNRRLATFSLSMSDIEESNYASDDNLSTSTGGFEDDDESKESDRKMWFRQRELRLSLILGISADEKCEKQLALHQDDDDSVLTMNRLDRKSAANQEHKSHHETEQKTRPSDAAATAFHEDREFDFLRSDNVRRCSSLKASTTPPGTPHRKKVVRFADALGLDLANVRHIINLDEPPIVPVSAMKDLDLQDRLDDRPPALVQVRHLCTCFSQPGCSPDFQRRVLERNVLLENCAVDDQALLISGIIRVKNIAFHKSVTVRYTVNGWMTYTDDPATYVSGSNDSATDRFIFKIQLPDYFGFGSRLEFSIMFVSGDQIFWDSNFGNNYRIECYYTMEPQSIQEQAKGDRFY